MDALLFDQRVVLGAGKSLRRSLLLLLLLLLLFAQRLAMLRN
jgi:hypothetical protein